MKNSTKFILSGLVLGATAGVTGAAYHANNNLIPAHMAAQINASFDNALEKNKPAGSNIEVTRGGAITVEATGILTYKVTMPALSVKAKDGVYESALAVSRSTYDLTFKDIKAAVNAGLRGDGEVGVVMTADKPVHFSSTIGNGDKPATLSGTCNSVVINGSVDGKKYGFDTEAKKCVVDGKIEEMHMQATLASNATFNNSLKNDGNDVFTGRSALRLEDVTVRAHNTRNDKDKAALDIKHVTMVVSYSELPTLSALPKALEELTLSSMPDGVSTSFEVEGLQASASNMPQLPTISASVGFGVDGLKKERGKVKAGFSYDVGPIHDPMLMMLAMSTPNKSACNIDVTDIPMKDITTLAQKTVDEAASGTGTPMGPEEFLGENGPVAAFEKAGTAVKLFCTTEKTGSYNTQTNAEHKAQDGGFPGKGTIRVEGIDNVLRDLSMVLGTDLSGLSEAFTALAVPTEDGKGVKWDYAMDKNGNITINGHNTGFGVPPMMPFMPR